MAAVGQVAEEGDPPVISGSQVAEEGGYVISKEGHRYLVGAGISGTYFFLPNKAIPKAKGELTMGQPIEGGAQWLTRLRARLCSELTQRRSMSH